MASATPHLESAALALLKPILIAISMLVSVFAVFNAISEPDHPIIPVLDAAVLVACAVVWLWLRRDRLPASWAHGVSAALGLAMALATLVRFELTADGICALHVIMEMIAFGVVSFSRPWLRGATAAITVGWLVASADSLTGRSYVEYGLVMVAAAALANMAFEVRMRMRVALEEALAETRSALTDRLEAEAHGNALHEQLVRSQKIEAIGLLAGGLAHDVNNVLQCIANLANGLCEELPVESSHHLDAAEIVNQSVAAASLTKGLLSFGRTNLERLERIDLGRVLNNVVRLVERGFPKQVSIKQALAHGDASVSADPVQLSHALVNLCLNASDAMSEMGTIELTTSRITLDHATGAQVGAKLGPYVVIRVIDHGAGMDAATKRRAFEPFFTTKPAEKGTGLGLAMVLRTMQRYGGAVAIDSEPGRGTTVSLYLPESDLRAAR